MGENREHENRVSECAQQIIDLGHFSDDHSRQITCAGTGSKINQSNRKVTEITITNYQHTVHIHSYAQT